MINGAVPVGKMYTIPVNKMRMFKAGTIIEFTGGNDVEYYIRVGNEKERPMIIILRTEIHKIEVDDKQWHLYQPVKNGMNSINMLKE